MMDIVKIIENNASRFSSKTAIRIEDTSIDYKTLNEWSNMIANALIQNNHKKGDYIGVYMSSSIEYIATFVGVLKMGGVILPLDAAYPIDRLNYFIEEVHPVSIITTKQLFSDFKKLENGNWDAVLTIELADNKLKVFGKEVELLHLSPQNINLELNQEREAYLIYTSGSTGTPKGILGNYAGLCHFIQWETKQFSLNENAVVSLLAPISFDVSFRDIFIPLYTGGTLCIPSSKNKFEPIHFLNWVKENKVSIIHCVPTFFRLLTNTVKENRSLEKLLHSLDFIFIAGEPLYGKDISEWRSSTDSTCKLINLYGPSETTLAKLFYTVSSQKQEDSSIIPLGNAIDDTSIFILNDGEQCAVNEEGEICISTKFSSFGYFKDQSLKKEKFIQNPLQNKTADILFKTGDFGYFSESGNIHFTRRKDDLIKLNGNRVELNEIQTTILKFEGISQVVVTVLSEIDSGDSLIVHLKGNGKIDFSKLREFISEKLPAYMIPNRFFKVDHFPLLPNGKIDKAALQNSNSNNRITTFTNDLEIEIAQIWKDVLKIDVSDHSVSFFELGGSSLKVIQMISKIYKSKGILLDITEFNMEPTVANCVKTIIRKKTEKEELKLAEVNID